ncbi:DUF1488 family protein [Methylobacterium sp. CM6257]
MVLDLAMPLLRGEKGDCDRLTGGRSGAMQMLIDWTSFMPLESYQAGQPVIDQETLAHVRFGMVTDRFGMVTDGKVIPCRVSIDGLRDIFHPGAGAFDPLDLFLKNRTEIEEAASLKYDLDGAPGDVVELDDTDFG